MRKKVIFKAVFSLFLIAVLMLGGCGRQADSGETNDRGKESEGEAEDAKETDSASGDAVSQVVFEGRDMDGNTVSSSVFAQSKLTMINVWATYCGPCLSEMPGLGELAGEYDSAEFQLIGIVGDVIEGGDQDEIDLAANLIEQTGADYPHLLVNKSLYDAFMTDLMGVPTTFFVNEEGEIIDSVLGAMDKESWEEKINELLEDL